MLATILFSILSETSATPSVWSCPFVPYGPPFDFRIGEDCPRDSFLHYYACCDDNPYQCCFHFETWAIVVFAIICIGVFAGVLFISGRLLLLHQRNST